MKSCARMYVNKLKLFLLVGGFLFISCSKNNGGVSPNPPSSSLPTISVKDASVKRQNTAATSRFYVDLSSTSDQQITVDYATADGSAEAGKDFTSTSGTLTFAAGEKEKSIDVPIKTDSLRQPKQQFYVQLSNPTNVKISTAKATGTIINNGTYLPTDGSGFDSPKNYPGYHLVWSDEFDGKTLNKNDWNYETGGGGWGNNELQNYTTRSENLFLSSGNLIISARKEDYGGDNYTSARITTQDKKTFTYGRIDIRAKLPVDHGLWPALWMMGNNISSVNWPTCGETDIMELIGKNPSQVVGSFHWKKSNGEEGTITDTHNLKSEDFSQKFHVFSLRWSRDSLQVLVDNIPYSSASRQELSNGTYAFDKPFFFIFNVAVGGYFPGPPDASTTFPQRMFVDYVRVFQKN